MLASFNYKCNLTA